MAWEEADSPGRQWKIRGRQEKWAASGYHRLCRSVRFGDSAAPKVTLNEAGVSLCSLVDLASDGWFSFKIYVKLQIVVAR